MQPADYVLYTVYPQLDRFGIDGITRVLESFSHIKMEADEYGRRMHDSYLEVEVELEESDLAVEVLSQSGEYYRVLQDLRQSVVNLLAVGLYHLFEQHKHKLETLSAAQTKDAPDFTCFPAWARIDELRLVANAVKHADGKSARKLRDVRPDLFVSSTFLLELRNGAGVGQAQLENPLGGTDLFLSPADLSAYRDALRELWEQVMPLL